MTVGPRSYRLLKDIEPGEEEVRARMRARRTHAVHSRETSTADRQDWKVDQPEELDLPGDSLVDAIHEQERRRQTDEYSSISESHTNGEVWVHWEDLTDAGSDRYQPVTEQGVRLGGCYNHRPERCWSVGDPFPPRSRAQHIVIGPLSRLAAHRHCEWAATMGPMRNELYLRTMSGSVGEDRCCAKPHGLTYAEQVQVSLVAADIAESLRLRWWVRNFDLLVGWRLFGVYDRETHWPGFSPLWDVDPSVFECWLVQLALQELA